MNCLPSSEGFTKILATNPKSSSVFMRWFTSRSSATPSGQRQVCKCGETSVPSHCGQILKWVSMAGVHNLRPSIKIY